jgi:hypothetical protein
LRLRFREVERFAVSVDNAGNCPYPAKEEELDQPLDRPVVEPKTLHSRLRSSHLDI